MVLVLIFMIVQGILNTHAFALDIRKISFNHQSHKTHGYSMIHTELEKLRTMNHETLKKYLSLTDLTDITNGVHPINLIIDHLKIAFRSYGYPAAQLRTGNRISSINDEFDRLHIPLDSRQRQPEYVRYINETYLLRSHTTPILLTILEEVKNNNLSDMLIFSPSICYRRDIIDKRRTGEPHKMDIWNIQKINAHNKKNELFDVIKIIIEVLSPNVNYRTTSTSHPYTANGLIVEVETAPDKWLKIFECGEISAQLLQDVGLDPKEYSVMGAGLGLERCVMYMKKVDDIRVFRAENPLIKNQMKDLAIYQPIIMHQPFQHTLTVKTPQIFTKEDICEVIRYAMDSDITDIEQVTFLTEGKIATLNQKEFTLEITFSSLDKVLTQTIIDSFINKISNQFNTLDIGSIT